MLDVERVETHMRNTDAFSWYMERDPLLRSTVVAVASLDSVPEWGALAERVDRASRLLPMFRNRVVSPPLRLATPRWAVAEEFDLDWHLRRTALRPGATFDEVLDLARVAATTAFDPARPLWQFTLVEGLSEGRAAFVMKFHHALTDGVGGVRLAMALFDLQRELPELGTMPADPVGEHLGGLRLAWEAVAYDTGRLVDVARHLPTQALRASARAARHPLAAAQQAAATAQGVARTVEPVTTTLSPLMTERRLARRLDVLDVPLGDLIRAAHTTDTKLNDAFLAGVTGGLRRYHEAHGSTVDRLRVTLPISIRKEGDGDGGNRITLVRLVVPAGEPDPVTRMRSIAAAVAEWRRSPSLDLTQQIAGVLNLLPSAVLGSILKHVDFLASNVPGFHLPLYLAGSRVEAYYPFGPTIGSAVNITLITYVDRCCLGVNMDAAAVPDPDVLMSCLRAGFDEVLDLAGEHAPARLPLHDGPG